MKHFPTRAIEPLNADGTVVLIYRSEKTVRATIGDRILAESDRALRVHEVGYTPVYYFPMADIDGTLLKNSDTTSHCPRKGDAEYLSAEIPGNSQINDIGWTYSSPLPVVDALKDHVAFFWNRIDHWYEDGEEVFGGVPDPFCRIDIRKCTKPVKVVFGGKTVADSDNALFLYETGLPKRIYVPDRDVAREYMKPSSQESVCTYKGTAIYSHLEVGEHLAENAAWSYPAPSDECLRIQNCWSFDLAKIDALTIAGIPTPKPDLTQRPVLARADIARA